MSSLTNYDSDYDGPEWAAPERRERIRSYVVEGQGLVESRPLDVEVALCLAEGAITAEQYQAFRAARHRLHATRWTFT